MSLRSRLRILVGTTAGSFVLLIGLNVWIGVRETRELEVLETRLAPELEFGPKLRARYLEMRRGVQAAVAAKDRVALDETRRLHLAFMDQIDTAQGVLSREEVRTLSDAAADYYATAVTVSARLVAGETGESVVDAIEHMEQKQLALATLLDGATRLERGDITRTFRSAHQARETGERIGFSISLGCLLIVLALSVRMSREVLGALAGISAGFARFSRGEFDQPIEVATEGDLRELAEKANAMASSLRSLADQRDRVDWVRTGMAGVSNELRGELDLPDAARRVVRSLVRYVDGAAGALYVIEGDGELRLAGSYASAADSGAQARPCLRVGEGLLGQVALEHDIRVIDELPSDYARVASGLGAAAPKTVVLVPLAHLGAVTAVLEVLLLGPCSAAARELFENVREAVAVGLVVARSRAALANALAESQSLTERLKAREEQLFENNRELVAQQEELRLANDELHAQRTELGQRNLELEQAHRRLQQKAEELATVSAYKSQFLANMSHELRTPLNSMLLLSQLLAENTARNLTDKQVEFCKTIHGAGTDLLKLINQVLDLTKIEAGRRDVELELIEIADLTDAARRVFEPLAADKGVSFEIDVQAGAPPNLVSDRSSVDQVLVNLLGNAIKFTQRGSVRFSVRAAGVGSIAFAVSDTGVGIALENQERVFTPFEQIGGYHDKRFGGTGLGLAIAKDIAGLIGGQLELTSSLGEGSTFTLTLPLTPRAARSSGNPSAAPPPATADPSAVAPIEDDRDTLAPNEAHLLVIEDDRVFAETLVELVHALHLKIIVAPTGEEGLRLARHYRPRGILLDVRLPDLDGWSVMAKLRNDPETRVIPVHFLSAVDKPERGIALGAVGYLIKPAARDDLIEAIRLLASAGDQRVVRVLVVEDDAQDGESLMGLLREERLEARLVTSAQEALEALATARFDCMILDLGLPDMDGLGLVDELERSASVEKPAIVVYTGRALTRAEAQRLEAYARAVVYKDGRATERLIEELRLFVRHVRGGSAIDKEWSAPPVSGGTKLFGKRVLLADDDMRTVYALSALLRTKGVEVLVADTGKNALEVLQKNPDVDAVLMDVMMPEMDGYEAMRRIRSDPRFQRLPMIALTAKAMKTERERCVAEGASDYIAKPVDGERLLAVLSNWLDPDRASA